MAEAIQFTEEEIQTINALRQEVGQTFTQLGQLSIQRSRTLEQLEQQEEVLLKQHQSLVEKEESIFKGLNEKYGDGNFDPKTGTFTPTPMEETTEAEG
tara:strand:+ start:256 stop:549 length:294 start_codon:yes stop_codon:yes gene_type:complete